MSFWYYIDRPRNASCWIINPELWKQFSLFHMQVYGTNPKKNNVYTEEYIVQFLDYNYHMIENSVNEA